MNIDTGELRLLKDLGADEVASGKWAPVSDALAQAAQKAQLEELVAHQQKLIDSMKVK